MTMDLVTTETGILYTAGHGFASQLGFETDEVVVPTPVTALGKEGVLRIVCGSLQTYVATQSKLYSFGNNDEGSLGRETRDDDDSTCYTPGEIALPSKCTMHVGGDSYGAALLENGQVHAWGSFKICNVKYHGVDFRKEETLTRHPVTVSQDLQKKVVKIAGGAQHVVMLCENGTVYTFGDGSCGQLGRKLPEKFRGNLIRHLLEPKLVRFLNKGKFHKATDIWTGEYTTFVRCANNMVWVFGANNWHQCGIPYTREIITYPNGKNDLTPGKWKDVAGGDFHGVALDMDGQVYCFGRNTEGQCGLGRDMECVETPTLIQTLKHKRFKKVAAGGRTSFAITNDGELYGWGIGEYLGLGDDLEEEYHFLPVQLCSGLRVLDVDGGAQHAAMVVGNNCQVEK